MWSDGALIAAGALAAAFATGATGTAFGLIAMAIWLHVMDPARAVPLVVTCSILLNLTMVWKLRDNISTQRLAPFLVGALFGVPLGIAALRQLNPALIRDVVGLLLIGYSVLMLTRWRMPVLALPSASGRVLDASVGMLGGFMGGSTSLNGVFPTLWSGLRGWTKHQQRGMFQPYILLVHMYTLAWLGGVGGLSRHTGYDVWLCVPALAAGGFLGLRVFHHASDEGFKKLILTMFLLSGMLLLL